MKFTSKLIVGLVPLSSVSVASGNQQSPALCVESLSPCLNASESGDRHKLSKRARIKEHYTEGIIRDILDSDHSERRKGHMLGLDRCKCQPDGLV